MAEIEYKGIKVGGSKLLLILPLIGTLIGGLWGGFELYNRLLIAEKKLNALNPGTIQQEITRLTELTDVIKDNLQGEISDAADLARRVDRTTAETQREIRNDVYDMEKEMQKRFREMDADIRKNKDELEEKIQTILENPLNDVE
jgi:gas vesicle protein